MRAGWNRPRRAFAEIVGEHVRAFHALGDDLAAREVTTAVVTFVHVSRDLETFSPEEMALHTALFARHFGDALVRNPNPDGTLDDDLATDEESVELALDALRDPAQRQRLVGVREEKRVIVYFVHPAKRTKVRARS